jgi:uncharacterized protein YfaS (alpha-2-macroglobulin family)
VVPDVFVYTDRPIYKPGDTLSFRGLVRKPASYLAELFAPKHPEVTVALDANGTRLTARTTVDDYGSFAGTLDIPRDADAGVVRLRAEVEERGHGAEARVQAYVKPTFYLELLGDAQSLTPGAELRLEVRARRYAGGAPRNTGYEVFLYRSVLDTPTWVDDAGLGAEGSAITYGGPATHEAELSIPTRLYSSVEARANASDFSVDDPWATAARFDASGDATITVKVPPLVAGEEGLPFKYTLTVRAQDSDKALANASKTFFVAASEVQGQVSPSAKLLQKGVSALLSVRALPLGGKPAAETTGDVS